MADNNERLGASFSIDVTNLKAGLAQANRLIKESQSEFKAAAAGMDDWTKSEEGLNAKIKSLNDITEIQRKKVGALQGEYDKLIADGLDPTSRAAVDLRTKINNEKAALAQNEAELAKQTKALNELEDGSDDASDALEDTGEAAKDAGDGFTIAKGAAADLVSRGLTALVGACKNAISSIAGLAEETKEYRNNAAKLQTAFEATGHSAETAQKQYDALYAVLGDNDQTVEASANLAKLAKDEEDLANWTEICTGIYSEFGSSLPIENLTEAANEVSKTGEMTGALSDAINWSTNDMNVWSSALGKGSKAQKAFSKAIEEGATKEDAFKAALAECTTEQERQELIQKTLNGLYGESAEKFRENNKAVIEANEAQNRYEQATAKLGDTVAPIMTTIKNGVADLLGELTSLTEDIDFEALQQKIENAFKTFKEDILPKIIEGLQWIKDNKDVLIAGITGIGAAFAAFKVVSLIQGVVSALNGMTLAQAALNLVMSLNPIGLVIAAVAGLVAAFVVLWKKCDGFREFWIGLWEKVKSAAKDAWEGIKNTFSKVGSFFGGIWDTIKEKFTSVGTKIGDAIGGAFKKAINAVLETVENAINKVPKAINKALDLINKLPNVNISPLPTISLPRLAKGGVVKGATTALIGEDGAEAVVPLEKNRQWIKAVAEELAAINQQGVVINQTNNYSAAHSRLELYKSKQQTAAAVRLAMGV